MRTNLIAPLILLQVFLVFAVPEFDEAKFWQLKDEQSDKSMHKLKPNKFINNQLKSRKSSSTASPAGESETNYWFHEAEKTLHKQLRKRLNRNRAKNIIFYLGDGMSVPTLMAARAYQGQLAGKTGEEGELFWETFPYSGLSKTWCLDKQVADSACTSTAYLCGVKTNFGTLGINGHVSHSDCSTQLNRTNHVDSILKWAQDWGKSVGFVTTTRVTHASPAGGYSHSANREWESDKDMRDMMPTIKNYHKSCMDISTQLITQDPGNKFNVIMGGGRRTFLPSSVIDEEGSKGHRQDGVNLIDQWKRDKAMRRKRHVYGWNRTMVQEVIRNPERYDYVLGLFESSHMMYHLEAPEETEPTLAEMTEAAVRVLRKNHEGFVLFVEGGRIDHAHHDTFATLALDETVELAKAVKIGRQLTSEEDTLVLVTSDHAHTMSISGYPERGNRIQGISTDIGDDGLPFTTLSYANGPGYKEPTKNGKRYDISQDDIDNNRYRFPALVPMTDETHGGDDVAIFASGPWAHLFTGSIDQSAIPHLLAYAGGFFPSRWTPRWRSDQPLE